MSGRANRPTAEAVPDRGADRQSGLTNEAPSAP